MTNHLEDIQSYCDAVTSGDRPACRWEKLAVKRHLKDLKRSKKSSFKYEFDVDKAVKILNFGELFPHVKGKLAGLIGKANRIKLEPWQKFYLAMIFGWVHKDSGLRKYRRAFLMVPRKNGKSIIAAIVGLFMMVEDGEFGAEIYCGATTEKQAWEVFSPAKKMVERSPAFRRMYGVSVNAKSLEVDMPGKKPLQDGRRRFPDGSKFQPVIGKPGDGSSPSCAILDEMHEHDDDDLYDTMLTGMGAREQPLLLIITTEGTNPVGPCSAVRKEVQKVLVDPSSDEELFGVIYTIDDIEEEWKTEEGVIKANPNAGISVITEYLLSQAENAKRNPRKRSTVLTKHFNVQASSKNAWLNMVEWTKYADPALKKEDFAGEEAGTGLDLSEVDDLTAKSECFRRTEKGVDHYYIFGDYYTTDAKVKEHKHYDEWVQEGYLIACDGEVINTQEVIGDILEDAEQFIINRVFFDPHGASHMAYQLDNEHDIEAIKFGQTYTNFTEPMREFERLLKLGRIHHDGNKCLTWMMGNIVALSTRDGKMMRPIKEENDNKIDGGVSTLMAFTSVFRPDEESANIYEERGLREL